MTQLTTFEAATLVGVTPDAIRKAVRTGRLLAAWDCGKLRIDACSAVHYRDNVQPRGKGAKRARVQTMECPECFAKIKIG
jgi:predicted GNAT superfamily acetyltransferase